MLFAKWQGTVTLPALPIRRTRIGGNLVVQHLFVRATCGAQTFDNDVKPGPDWRRAWRASMRCATNADGLFWYQRVSALYARWREKSTDRYR